MAARYFNITSKEIVVNLGEGIRLGKLNIATNDALQMNTFLCRQKSKPAFSVDSYYDVLNGDIAIEKYAGKSY